jgi:carbon storage regulator CsrA
MLVLSRKKNESIVISDNVRIEVLKISGNTIRLGIVAPRDVKVMRGEIAPFEVSEKRDSKNQSKDSDIQNPKTGQTFDNDSTGETIICEMTLPIESEESSSLPNPFVAQAI